MGCRPSTRGPEPGGHSGHAFPPGHCKTALKAAKPFHPSKCPSEAQTINACQQSCCEDCGGREVQAWEEPPGSQQAKSGRWALCRGQQAFSRKTQCFVCGCH